MGVGIGGRAGRALYMSLRNLCLTRSRTGLIISVGLIIVNLARERGTDELHSFRIRPANQMEHFPVASRVRRSFRPWAGHGLRGGAAPHMDKSLHIYFVDVEGGQATCSLRPQGNRC